uniref:Uncharacterized protein n=1 Tax=Myoviridae sp. ctiBE32 TaxID=2826685 RepID=A0A8S5N6U4_9CAUD|nr:MAG TPA: hypothetical protein [Myoviridae sp. ctiBE32]
MSSPFLLFKFPVWELTMFYHKFPKASTIF